MTINRHILKCMMVLAATIGLVACESGSDSGGAPDPGPLPGTEVNWDPMFPGDIAVAINGTQTGTSLTGTCTLSQFSTAELNGITDPQTFSFTGTSVDGAVSLSDTNGLGISLNATAGKTELTGTVTIQGKAFLFTSVK